MANAIGKGAHDLFALSDRIISEGVANEPVNRMNFELSELTDNCAMVEAFSHVIVMKTDDGLVAFDTSGALGGEAVVKAIRTWDESRFNSLIYTHGHIDHVGGCGCFITDAECKKHPAPKVIGHENVAKRFDRYNMTNGYNVVINERQFGQGSFAGLGIGGKKSFLPQGTAYPDITYEDRMDLSIGGLDIELHHAKGETDDHTWAWVPETKTICAGDFFIWNFPNAGNPQKAQRYPIEWAQALRKMSTMGAEYFMPAHGLPIRGHAQIKSVLNDVASALENLVEAVLEMMNEGAKLNTIIHEVKVPDSILSKPYLRPLYDEPEFVVQNIWRLYGGWYDGNPANLKPARDADLAKEIVQLVGSAHVVSERAKMLSEKGEHRLACHLIELAVAATPDDKDIHETRVEVYKRRQKSELSLMSKGIYRYASNQSRNKLSSETSSTL